jgi:hypothetical protein
MEASSWELEFGQYWFFLEDLYVGHMGGVLRCRWGVGLLRDIAVACATRIFLRKCEQAFG